ncbi:MAG: hypothetical protein IKA87_10305 [Lentisphaeria bacterium]|nr:hypothetical protein [Lentisphaeria bacterium]
MIKRLFAVIAIFLLFPAVLTAGKSDEQKLLKLVPTGAKGVISADLSAWLCLPVVQKKLAESREIWKNYGFEITDIGAILFWGNEEKWALLTAYKKGVEPGKLFPAPYFSCVSSETGGVRVWRVSAQGTLPQRKRGTRQVSFQATVMQRNILCILPDNADAAEIVKLMKSACGVKYPAAAAGSLRGVLRNGKPPMPEKAVLSCRMTGKQKSDLEGFLSLTVGTPEEASQLCAQGMLMTNLLLVGAMQNDPQLAADIVQCLKFASSQNNVSIKFSLKAELLERIGKFVSEEAREKRSIRKNGKRRSPSRFVPEKNPAENK